MDYLNIKVGIILVAGIIFATPIYLLVERLAHERGEWPTTVFVSCRTVLLIGLLFLSETQIATGSFNPFIYFRF